MNIITKPFENNINLAICVFPADTLHQNELKDKMMDYTIFYALRFRQLINDQSKTLEIFQTESIESALQDLSQEFDHILFMAAGVRIYDMTVLFDIKDIIEKNPNYFVAAHILDWKDDWYELHHQFVLVNTKKWIAAGSPIYGNWEKQVDRLPVIERSKENFHDDYTPLWIKFTGEYVQQSHSKQGWNFINQAAKNGFDVINWDKNIRNKRTYYYPESQSENFLQAFKTLEIDKSANFNQRSLIGQIKSVSSQIWVLNSENMDLELDGNDYDTIALPAAGFKFLNVFQTKSLKHDGTLIIYDYNQNSLDWIESIYKNTIDNIDKQILESPYRDNFKFLDGRIFSTNLNGKYMFTKPFVDSLKITKEFFGGSTEFDRLLDQFRSHKNVKFINVDIINHPTRLTQEFNGKTAVNISNIFCSDFSNAYIGMKKTTDMFIQFLSSIETNTLLIGQDSYCRQFRKEIIRNQK